MLVFVVGGRVGVVLVATWHSVHRKCRTKMMMAVCLDQRAVIGTGLLFTSLMWMGVPSAFTSARAGSDIAGIGISGWKVGGWLDCVCAAYWIVAVVGRV